jgi:2,4-dienoyl-CoA reductase-like NADH-dependent reductase (Old Yellow Enzyme family)/thioredoxin reductase
MGTGFPNLLRPGKIGRLDVSNRIVSAPMGSLNGDKEGFVTDSAIRFYVEEAKGGMGLIIVESAYTDTILSKAEANELGIWSHEHVTGWARLVSCVHDYDTKIMLQLSHIGHQLGLAAVCESLGPSEMVEMQGGIKPFPIRGITREEMAQIIDDFAVCAWRAKMAGFDGVEIHGAIGHLISMFCTPFYNRRNDEYGGTPENRIRFMVEIVEATRKKCGHDFPVIARISGCDYDPDGLTLEEGILHAKILEQAGVAAMHIIGGSSRNIRVINSQYDPRGDFVPIAAAMKKAGIKAPLIIDGGLSTPDLAEMVLAEGKADFIGLGRPTLADPQWANKVREGRPEDIVPCIRCTMGCVGYEEPLHTAYGLRCSVNPRCNMAGYREIQPLAKKKNLCVVGGGPAGMEAARLAKIRGHEVTLYEKRKLGGAMNEAAFDPELKGDIRLLINYYVNQMQKLNINVVYEEATLQTVIDGNYDAVIVATGAAPRRTKLPGTDKAHVHSVWEYCGGHVSTGETVLIVGGGLVACEIALSLAKKGKKPILTTRRGKQKGAFELASDNSYPAQARLLLLLMERKVEFQLFLDLKEVTDDGAVFTQTNSGETVEIKADTVLLCRGYNRELKLYRELKDKVPELYRIGDCKEARIIHNAIEEGWAVANRL